MNEHKNIITIEDEIKEFSDKPVKSSALFKALEEKGLPDASEASVGDVLTKGEDGIGWETPSGGDGRTIVLADIPVKTVTDGDHVYSSDNDDLLIGSNPIQGTPPAYFVPYEINLGDQLVFAESGIRAMVVFVQKTVISSNGSSKNNDKRGDTKGAGVGGWTVVDGTVYLAGIYGTNSLFAFVSADAVIEYRE